MRRIKDNLQFSITNGMLSIYHPDYSNLTIEVPIKEDDTIEYTKQWALQTWINYTLVPKNHYLQRHYGNTSIRDDTYMNGSICRVDFTPETQQGAEIALKVKDEFPDVYIHKNFGESGEEYDMALFTQYKSDRYENEIETFREIIVFRNFERREKLLANYGKKPGFAFQPVARKKRARHLQL